MKRTITTYQHRTIGLCSMCGGGGTVKSKDSDELDRYPFATQQCPDCEGSGLVVTQSKTDTIIESFDPRKTKK